MRILTTFTLALTLLSCTNSTFLPTDDTNSPASQAKPRLSGELPFDDDVVAGKLDNGLHYYLRHNGSPENRAYLRLVVKVGSLHEKEDELGIAHYLEHMAFNGSEHFAKNDLIAYFESIGLTFGSHLNAYTTFDHTNYMLEVPLDKPEYLETALQVFADWAHGLNLDKSDVDQERGIVIEEWRGQKGARERVGEKIREAYFAGTRLLERPPIGTLESLEKLSHQQMKAFYETWYQPENMALVAVGDFKTEHLKSLIEKYLGDIPNQSTESIAPVRLNEPRATQLVLATDSEATVTNIQLNYLNRQSPITRAEQLDDTLLNLLWQQMFNARLEEITIGADAPFLAASGSRSRAYGDAFFATLAVRVANNQAIPAVSQILTSLEQVQQYGFSASELERAKKSLQRGLDLAWQNRENRKSTQFIGEYINHFLEGHHYPSLDYEYRVLTTMLEVITATEVNNYMSEQFGDAPDFLVISGPERLAADKALHRELLTLPDSIAATAIKPYEDQLSRKQLIDKRIKPGKIVSREKLTAIDATRLQLSNGVSVVLKHTEFESGQVLFRAQGFGGLSRVPDDQLVSASQATTLVNQSGVSDFSIVELRKLLAGKSVSIFPWVTNLEKGLSGQASPADLETMLELNYLYMTAPSISDDILARYRKSVRDYQTNRLANHFERFYDRLLIFKYADHPRRQPWYVEDAERIDKQSALSFYRNQFQNAADFTFVLVGNFEQQTIEPLIERYLASLPAQTEQSAWLDREVRPIEGQREFLQPISPEAKTTIQLNYYKPYPWSKLAQHELSFVQSILQQRLRNTLREDLGGVYSVSVSSSILRRPYANWDLLISFSCAPERADELIEATQKELRNLIENGVTEAEMATVKQQQIKNFQLSKERNQEWLSMISHYEKEQLDYNRFLTYENRVDAISAQQVKARAKDLLSDANLIQSRITPEPSAEVAH